MPLVLTTEIIETLAESCKKFICEDCGVTYFDSDDDHGELFDHIRVFVHKYYDDDYDEFHYCVSCIKEHERYAHEQEERWIKEQGYNGC